MTVVSKTRHCSPGPDSIVSVHVKQMASPMRGRPYGDKCSKEEAQLALRAVLAIVRDRSTKEAVFELRLEGPLRCTRTKGRVAVSVPEESSRSAGTEVSPAQGASGRSLCDLGALESRCWV